MKQEENFEMEVNYAIEASLHKSYGKFELNIPRLMVPKGFATALIGENGAGKTTLLNILAGIRLDYQGEITYLGRYSDRQREELAEVKEKIGFTGPGSYYLPQWKIAQVAQISELLFSTFKKEHFDAWCRQLAIGGDNTAANKKISSLSDGNREKLMIAGVLSRDTELLLMDEPASPLDPLMRERLCEIIRDYLLEDEGERSVFFSTHNIADMEAVTDYAIIMAEGKIAEAGFVEDLKEKYVYVRGEAEDITQAQKTLFRISSGKYGFEGVCLAEKLEQLAGCDISLETPTLSQISVAVMEHSRSMEMRG